MKKESEQSLARRIPLQDLREVTLGIPIQKPKVVETSPQVIYVRKEPEPLQLSDEQLVELRMGCGCLTAFAGMGTMGGALAIGSETSLPPALAAVVFIAGGIVAVAGMGLSGIE